MEIHNEDRRPSAQREKTELTKKVTHELPLAQRSIKTNPNVTTALKNGSNVVGKTVGTASKTIGSVGSTIATSADNSTAGGATVSQSVKVAQITASGVVAGGRIVSTAIKASGKTAKVVAKVPNTVKRLRFETTRRYKKAKRYAKLKMRLVKRNFKPQAVANNVKKAGKAMGAVGNVVKTGAGIAGRATSAIESSLHSGECAGTASMGLAIQGSRSLATGVRTGGKAVRVSTKVTTRTLKTTRKIATKVGRGIASGTAKRALKTSVQATNAAKEAAKVSAKTAQTTAKATEKIIRVFYAAVARAASTIMATAPFSFVVIGIFVLIILGGGMFILAASKL